MVFINNIMQSSFIILFLYFCLFSIILKDTNRVYKIYKKAEDLEYKLNKIDIVFDRWIKFVLFLLIFIVSLIFLYDLIFNLFILENYYLVLILSLSILFYNLFIYLYFFKKSKIHKKRDLNKEGKFIYLSAMIFLLIIIFSCYNAKITDINKISKRYPILKDSDFIENADDKIVFIKLNSFLFPKAY